MGLLDQLWDETVAGPRPESGLSKLRKHSSFSPSSANEYHEISVTRNITILRTSSVRNPSLDAFSNKTSPAGSSAPSPPFSPNTSRGDLKKQRRKPTDNDGEPKTPTGYDWLALLPLSCQKGSSFPMYPG
ncbi:hypothetical protein ACLOJK_000957 [Asimina triloba]